MIHIVGISGGKDSGATYLTALERGLPFRAVSFDTGNEHPWTLEYIADLSAKTGGPPVETVRADFSAKMIAKARALPARWSKLGLPDDVIEAAVALLANPTGNPFIDLCLLKGRFPSSGARFCTEELKVFPAQEHVYEPLLSVGETVVSWQGVRGQESAPRALLPVLQRLEAARGRLYAYRPLHAWTVEQVFALHDRHGLRPNRLYAMGASRVGCFPCIMCRKAELAFIARGFPEVMARLRDWEARVSAASLRQAATFFYIGRDPLWFADGRPDVVPLRDGIDRMAAWSKTDKGGRQMLLDFEDETERKARVAADYATACNAWGACE